MELKFVTRESDYLVFETQQGDRLRALIDDGLREAIRKEQANFSSGVSPREVQSALRSGKSLEEIAADLGVPERAIEPFAAPILDELRYILDAALKTTLPSGNQMVSFGELVAQSFPTAQLKVYKNLDRWIVEDLENPSLSWFFDPKTRHIEPLGDAAKTLLRASRNPETNIPASALRSVSSEQNVHKPVDVSAPEEGPGASIHDLVQQLRERKAPEQTKPASAKGRAALPSWDEIVLGTGMLEPNPDERDS
ncbi:septation protein SepH [Candidatus Aquiluna sp. UB-MaderosW2red]|uniref:septation protein SepH n=1 Tax=Candidatus Aquiluna sp. UB-MaderosW2red TaxID=1855377 RepID=UPI000875E4F6|nr:septation protein SepH [Candidatus Aquiluna sp. UB-MaderosW2red]SCX11171.1 Protein of unknown function [Candidatus Aquiluna sp. UB-MaderosW2red]